MENELKNAKFITEQLEWNQSFTMLNIGLHSVLCKFSALWTVADVYSADSASKMTLNSGAIILNRHI